MAGELTGETAFQRQVRDGLSPYEVRGIPAGAPDIDATLLHTRLTDAVDRFSAGTGLKDLEVLVTTRQSAEPSYRFNPSGRRAATGGQDRSPDLNDLPGDGELDLDARATRFPPVDPLYSFDFLVLPVDTQRDLMLAVGVATARTQVFEEWNLRSIQPFAGVSINLHGGPGTGKTLAAHAIASLLDKKIIEAKYSELESKYQGEGPKNLSALFRAAVDNDAVLFLDEADAVMSQRLANVTQGAEHAINAMRSELLMCLDRFDGLAVFASNLAESYDTAFDSRVRHVHFPDPNLEARREIWRRHIPAELPVTADLDLDELAGIEGLSGREIRRAVVDAAVDVSLNSRGAVHQADLVRAAQRIKSNRITPTREAAVTMREPDAVDREIGAALSSQPHPASPAP
ncbi:ATP-binding protein [Frankia sp. AgKG'84/4]|uniref:ATP-binding protein n=1 Tax=Frankia sp. AgKG'84/4 TaxID=573490 RepID=UPI00200E233C|nr:ATP-binding protein [Frankia sp. AgKG'84/4]MCL9796494.1 ATP-binding protein [Frankia sp. AgKG'84/4]